MAKYDSRADLSVKVLEAEAALRLAKIKLAAFDWLVSKDCGSITAASLCEWPDSIKASKEFAEDEKEEYRKIWDNCLRAEYTPPSPATVAGG